MQRFAVQPKDQPPMPSPILHLTTAYLAASSMDRSWPQTATARPSWRQLCVVSGVFSLLPDVDCLPGLVLGAFGRFHNNQSHSLLVGLGVATVFGGIAHLRHPGAFWFWWRLSFLSYGLHIVLDFLGAGRGVRLFWPLSSRRWRPPVRVFRGIDWPAGWRSRRHLASIAEELSWAVCVVGIAKVAAALRACRQ